MFGTIPAYGFFVRHVRGLEMRDVEVRFTKEESRPAFVLDDVKGVDLRGIKAATRTGVLRCLCSGMSRTLPSSRAGVLSIRASNGVADRRF
jgi:hypothetical protein